MLEDRAWECRAEGPADGGPEGATLPSAEPGDAGRPDDRPASTVSQALPGSSSLDHRASTLPDSNAPASTGPGLYPGPVAAPEPGRLASPP